MTMELFSKQIARLVSTFGPRLYPDERVTTIWKAVNDLTDEWFEKTVTDFIANNRFGPLPAEFMTAADDERKNGFAKRFPLYGEINPHEESIFSRDEIHEFFTALRAIQAKRLTPGQADEYAAMVQKLIWQKKSKMCRICDESGVVLRFVQKAKCVYKCTCKAGLAREENWPTLQRNALPSRQQTKQLAARGEIENET